MPKPPQNWPNSVLPRRLTRQWAAFYCGVSGNTFDAMLRAGEFPAPDANGKYDLKLIDFAIDRRNGLADDPEERAVDWTIKRRSSRREGTRG